MGGPVVITGGAGALGRAFAAAFRAAGHPVDAPGRDALDVTSPRQIRDYFHGRSTELLICNAGVTRDAPLARLDEQAWDEVLAVNLRAAALCAASASRAMVRARHGHLLFISSYSALHPPAGQAAYAAAKAGLLGLARSLARELGPAGIRANVILPGFLETPMTEGVTPRRREAVLEEHALGRFTTPDAAASFAVHLHRHLPHTSGQVFQLDSRTG